MWRQYCRLALWHGIHLEDVMRGKRAKYSNIMLEHLPYLIDEYFVSMQSAVMGGYQLLTGDGVATVKTDSDEFGVAAQKAEARWDHVKSATSPLLTRLRKQLGRGR